MKHNRTKAMKKRKGMHSLLILTCLIFSIIASIINPYSSQFLTKDMDVDWVVGNQIQSQENINYLEQDLENNIQKNDISSFPNDFQIYFTMPQPGTSFETFSEVSEGSLDSLKDPQTASINRDTDYCVILVQFTDYTFTTSISQVNDLIFSETIGMKAYFKENSYNQYLISGDLALGTSVLNMGTTISYYGADATDGSIDVGNGHPNRLASDAIDALDSSIDFSDYDSNDDGIVDHLILVHAGPGQETNPDATDLIWSHYSGVYSSTDDGVEFTDYTVVSETSPVGVIAHEASHDLGLIDLYDIDYSSDGIGLWGLMAAGAWLDSPAHLVGYNKIQLGWVTPTIISDYNSIDLSLQQYSLFPQVFRLDISDSEYFLIENRYGVGSIFDGRLPGNGLLITHIDESQTDNRVDYHRLVDIEEADGNEELDVYGGYLGQAGDVWVSRTSGFTDLSTPSTRGYDGSPSTWEVYNIGAAGSTMTLSVKKLTANDLKISTIEIPSYISFGNASVDSDYVYANQYPRINVSIVQAGELNVTNVSVSFSVYQEVISLSTVIYSEVQIIQELSQGSPFWLSFTFPINQTDRYIVKVLVDEENDLILENNEIYQSFRANGFINDLNWDFEGDLSSEESKWSFEFQRYNRLGIVKTTSYSALEWELRSEIIQPDIDTENMPSPANAWHFGYHSDQSSWITDKFVTIEDYNASMTTNSPFSLTNYNEAYLTFYAKYVLSEITDSNNTITQSSTPLASQDVVDQNLIRVRISTDGITWLPLEIFSGINDRWTLYYFNITEYIGQNIYLQFRAEMQRTVAEGGFFFDSLQIVSEPFSNYGYLQFVESEINVPQAGTNKTSLKIINLGDFVTNFDLNHTLIPVSGNADTIIVVLSSTSLTMWVNSMTHITIVFNASEESTITANYILRVGLNWNVANDTQTFPYSPPQSEISLIIGDQVTENSGDTTTMAQGGTILGNNSYWLAIVIVSVILIGIVRFLVVKRQKTKSSPTKTEN